MPLHSSPPAVDVGLGAVAVVAERAAADLVAREVSEAIAVETEIRKGLKAGDVVIDKRMRLGMLSS